MVVPSVVSKEYVLGIYPSNDPLKVERAFSPLAALMGQALGAPVRLAVTRDYQELLGRLADGSVQLAWLGPVLYAQALEAVPGLRYIATYREEDDQGRPTSFYRSCIVVRRDSTFLSLADLRGRHFAFVDPGSASGYLYPLRMLRNAGIEPDRFFSKVFFLKKHDKVAEAVLASSVAAGALSDGTFRMIQAARGPVLRVLAESEPIPLDSLAALPALSPEAVRALRSALMRLEHDDPELRALRTELRWPASGFSVLSPDLYQGLRGTLREGVRP